MGKARNRIHLIATALLCATVIAGCATKVPFDYTPSWVPEDDIPPPWNNATVSVVDNRSDSSVDEFLTTAVDHAIGKALADELRSAGLAAEASFGTYLAEIPTVDLQQQGIDAHLVANVQELRWEIVNYPALLATTFVVGLTTGLVGTAIMSATKTDVDGHAKIDVRLTDILLGRSFSKAYAGHCEQEWPTFEADQPEARSRIVACAFGNAIRELGADLEGFAATLPPPASSHP